MWNYVIGIGWLNIGCKLEIWMKHDDVNVKLGLNGSKNAFENWVNVSDMHRNVEIWLNWLNKI